MRALVMWIGMMIIVGTIGLSNDAIIIPSMNVYRWIGIVLVSYVAICAIVNRSITLNWVGLTFLIMGILYIIFGKAYIFF